jgi:hypothetical protein
LRRALRTVPGERVVSRVVIYLGGGTTLTARIQITSRLRRLLDGVWSDLRTLDVRINQRGREFTPI